MKKLNLKDNERLYVFEKGRKAGDFNATEIKELEEKLGTLVGVITHTNQFIKALQCRN